MSHRSLQTRPEGIHAVPAQLLKFSSNAIGQNSKSDRIEHFPVLLKEVLQYLSPQPGGFYIDATIGLGGHSEAILEASGTRGELLGIDRDQEALSMASHSLARYRGRYHLVHANFAELKEIAEQRGFEACNGILADLGVSSLQLNKAERGFSFQKEGPLDMRMDQDLALTADEVINQYSERDLANLIFQFGEEHRSRVIARAIVRSRPIHGTTGLASVIAAAIHSNRRLRIHPATRTFQALRIFVNDELGKIAPFIRSAVDLLKVGGRIAIISFHSLEDRIVKETFRQLTQECNCRRGEDRCECGKRKVLKVLTKKPVLPTDAEIRDNPRSRSAKLRVAERI
jgi:16S rRNA (cytosine1402-N4)-methyltransferase